MGKQAKPEELEISLPGFEERLSAIEEMLGKIYGELFEVDGPRGPKPRLSPGQRVELGRKRAFNARQGRAAKALGITLEEFRRQYGAVDRVPKGAKKTG